MNENVTLDGYFDEAREYIEANAKNEIQTERLNEMIFGLHEEWKHRAKTMDSNKNANETVNFNVQTIHVRNEIVKFAYDTDAIFNFIINFKPGNPTPLGMGRRALFLQKNKKISYFFTLS